VRMFRVDDAAQSGHTSKKSPKCQSPSCGPPGLQKHLLATPSLGA
jgi:hypothetical protein